MATMTKTMAVVIAVSRREGQVTFAISERTSCRNLNGLTFAMCAFDLPSVRIRPARSLPSQRDRPADPFWETYRGGSPKRAASERLLPTAGRRCRQAERAGPGPMSINPRGGGLRPFRLFGRSAQYWAAPAGRSIGEGGWQEWRDSNAQPPVLETGALTS